MTSNSISWDGISTEGGGDLSNKLNKDFSNVGASILQEINIDSSIARDSEVPSSSTLLTKLDIDFTNIGSNIVPLVNLPNTVVKTSLAQSIAGVKTITDTLIIDGGYNIRDAGMVSNEAWIGYSSHPSNHILVLGWRDASGTFTNQYIIYTNDKAKFFYDLETDGDLILDPSKKIKFGTANLDTTHLDNYAQIPLLNDTSLGSFNSDILTTGNFRADGGQLQLDIANTYRLARNTTTGNLEFEIPTGEDYNFFINTVRRLNINNATSIFTGDVYDNGVSDANNKLQNVSNATNLINTILSSATTANSTKLNLVEGGNGTGFDGSATSFAINHLNPITVQEFQHRPTGVGGAYVALPSRNTFNVNCDAIFNRSLTVNSNTTIGITSVDTLTINSTTTHNTMLNTSGITDVNGIITSTLQCANVVVNADTILGASVSDSVNIRGNVVSDVNFNSSSDIVRSGQNYLDRVDELFTDYRTSVVDIPATDFVANGKVKLFDTDDFFNLYKYGTDTLLTRQLNSTDLTNKSFHMLLSFQGYTGASSASGYLFDWSGGLHSSLKIGVYGVIGHNNVGTNDGVAPNSLILPNSVAYHISGIEAPRVEWEATTSGVANYNLIWGSSAIPAGLTGTTNIIIKLIPIGAFP